MHSMQKVCSLWRCMWLGCARGVHVPWDTAIGAGVEIRATDGGQVVVGVGAALARGVLLVAQEGRIRIGGGRFVGPGSIIVSKAGISIGEDVLVAERVTIRDQDHAIHGDLSLPSSRAGFVSAPIIIGDGAWIAAGAVILKGVTIGKGAVVAANAVVNRDVADFEIVGGVPAQRIGMRGNNGNN